MPCGSSCLSIDRQSVLIRPCSVRGETKDDSMAICLLYHFNDTLELKCVRMKSAHTHSQACVKVQLGQWVGSLPSVALCVSFILGMASPECLFLSCWSTGMHTGRDTACLIFCDHPRAHLLHSVQYRLMQHHLTSSHYPDMYFWELVS